MKMVTIRLSEKNAELLAQNIDGWSDAGACEGGLTADEKKALGSAYDQIARQIYRPRGLQRRSDAGCDCENPTPKTGVALVSENCPIHGRR